MKGNFGNIINGPKPVLVDFHAEWCGPCKAQAPILKDVAKSSSGRLRIIKIDIDKNPAIAQQYQVRGVPTLALFKNGKLLWKQSGLQTKHQIESAIKQSI